MSSKDGVIQFEGTIYENGYGLIAQKVMRDKTLPKQSRLIYAYMCSFASIDKNGERTAFPSVDLQCAELGMSEDTYYKWRKPLIERGFIKIKKQRNKDNTFNNNLYSIVAVPKEVKKEEDQEPTPKKEDKEKPKFPNKDKKTIENPHPKNSGAEKEPYPKSSGMGNPYPKNPSTEKPDTENPSTEKQGTNTITFNSINLNNNNENINLYLNQMNKYIWEMKLPMQLKKFFSDKVKILATSDKTFDITEVEYFYNTYKDVIKPDCTREDVLFLNDIEFTKVIKKMYENVERPISNMEGLIKTWVQWAIHYKIENSKEVVEYESILEEIKL